MIDTKELREAIQASGSQTINEGDLNELLDRLEAAEKERDNYKFAFSEYSEKTEWVQQGINDGTVSAKYLGWHRADVMSDLLSAAEKERDALRAKVSDLTIVVEYLDKLKKSYEELIGELQEDRDALRAKIEAMEKQEPVAWLHESRRDSDVVTSAVKHVWGKAAVGSMAAYSIPLYALPGAKGE